METIKIKLFVTLILTLKGKKKRYKLGDMAYGEYLVYKNNFPKYYLHLLDVPNIAERAKGGYHVESKLPDIENGLTLRHGVNGIPLRELEPEWIDLEEIPSSLFKFK